MDADWETLVNEGIEARKQGDGAAWRLGDLALSVETHYGQGDLEKYAERIGAEYKTLLNYRTVARRFEGTSRQRENLSFTHHAEVASREDAEDWLERAEREDWSVAQLREAVAADAAASAPIPPPLPAGQYRVLYADPPWAYDNSGFDQSAAKQYPTLAAEDIAAYRDEHGKTVRALAGPDSVLFLWVTNPQLPEGLLVAEAWGFEYKTDFVWIKEQQTGGFYALGAHELLYVCTRGSCLPNEGSLVRSVIEAPRREHSRKPDKAYEIIERMYDGPYVELFARRPREGWDSWGQEMAD